MAGQALIKKRKLTIGGLIAFAIIFPGWVGANTCEVNVDVVAIPSDYESIWVCQYTPSLGCVIYQPPNTSVHSYVSNNFYSLALTAQGSGATLSIVFPDGTAPCFSEDIFRVDIDSYGLKKQQ